MPTQPAAASIIKSLTKLANPKLAKDQLWFYQTQKGGYGEGDKFLGIRVPVSRSIAKANTNLPLTEIAKLTASKYHEIRFIGLAILVLQYQKAKDAKTQKQIFDFYLKLVKQGQVNNWDLVDATAPYLGHYLVDKADAMKLLQQLIKSKNLWVQRTGVLFTFAFIRAGNNKPTLLLAKQLLNHPHDLIHKATGWMLREAGKRNISDLRGFLSDHSAVMPRTMLRYAIEKLPEAERKKWLAKKS
ncbi:MAG: DNA alkylation repair protein [Actinobacteria bacterium]|nr:DNA alkylation repair protein [Actinomycetota bacterium]